VKVIIDALKGLAVYQEKGYVHGDLKEANIIVFDGPNGPQAQLIDNSPTPMDQVTSIPFAWTPQYTSPWSRGITHGSPEMFRVWDNTSMGIVIGELIKYKGMTELQPIHDKLVGYDNTSPEALSEAIAALEGILPQMSKLKPGQVVFGNPKDADSNMQTSPAAPIQ
jgi:serine/threonine protein kinase